MFNLFKNNNKSNYKFKEPETTACFTCDHILNKQRPILYVSHDDEDGGWQFLCGHEEHSEENAKVISLKQATEIDESINYLYEMPLGYGAERTSVEDTWAPFKMAD